MKKRILSIALCMILTFCLFSCGDSSNKGHNGDYDDGYEEGYRKAFLDAQSYADVCYSEVLYENNVEAALAILTKYADGEPISEAELHQAIWAINKFYYDTSDMINDLDDYLLYQ